MSITDTLINNWLNLDINFEPKILDIYTDFKNGYYFGQLLLKLELISEKEANLYQNGDKFYDIRNNFYILQKHLNDSLAHKLRNEEIDDLINNNNKYNIISLLYKIKNCYYKYKINFNSIKIVSSSVSPQDFNQKINELLNYDNINAPIENNKEEGSKFYTPKQKIPNIKKIKLQKVSISSLDKKEPKLPTEKDYIKKRILLPKIQKEIHSQNLNYVIPEEDKDETTIKHLSKNQSQTNILKYPPLSIFEKDKKKFKIKRFDLNISHNNNVSLIKNKSLNNIFQKRINLLNNKDIEVNKKNEKPIYNFIKKDKTLMDKILNKLKYSQNAFIYLEQNFILYDVRDNSKYKSSFKRKEYSDIFKKETEKNIIIKRLNNFNNLFYKLKQIQKNNKVLSSSAIVNNNLNLEEKDKFNRELFFQKLDNCEYKQYQKYCEKKYKIFEKHKVKIRELVLLIISVTMEGYIYQEETRKDLIDIPFYLKLIRLFLKNKQIKRKLYIDEFKLIKEVSKLDDTLDPSKITLKKDELFFLKDYLYFLGFWNKSKILDSKLLGKRIEYKLLFNEKPKVEEYEPTEMEQDDLTLPSKYHNNFDFGDLISEFIEHKYSQQEQMTKNDKYEELNQMSKWFHIRYKISLVGKSFIFNKYIAQQINKKYPNLKIYSLHKLLNDYSSEYNKLINEPEQKATKIKSKKANQEELRKKQREERLEELKPVIDIIRPYLDQIENNKKITEIKADKKIDSFIIPQDELLLKLLIYQIEKDFPIKAREEIIEEIKENNNRINEIIEKINEIKSIREEKEKEKTKGKEKNNSKKDKDEKNLDILEKELINIKSESIKGFILIDFPNNINQCNLLEQYLTDYIDDLQKPKSLKNKEIEKFNEITDIKSKPNKGKKLKNSGIDFLINLSTSNQNEINSLFINIKYDPVEDCVHSKLDLDISNDKKLNDRLVDKIYYYNDKLIEYYKSENEENISKIKLFYDKFGFYIDEKSKNNNNNLSLNLGKKVDDNNNMGGIKVYQKMNLDDIIQQIGQINNPKENKKKKKMKANKNNKDKKENENKEEDKANNSSSLEIYQIFSDNVLDFFTIKIELLYETINKTNKLLTKNNAENENLKQNLKSKKTNIIQEKDKIIYNLKNNSNELLSSILYINEEYKMNLNKFIYLLFNQKNDIYQRFNLIQKKYRDFLNRETEKKKIIHKYVVKYNHFFDLNKDLLYNEDVQKEFMSDIEYININLWQIISLKKNESIEEINEIKNCGYIEIEVCKFFNNIKNLLFSELNKYICTINTLVEFYLKYFIDDKISNMKNSNISGPGNILSKLINLKEELDKSLLNIKQNSNPIFNDLISINEIINNNDSKRNTQSEFKGGNSLTKYNMNLLSKIKLIIKNIKILFFNCIKYMISENDIIIPFLKLLSEINTTFRKRTQLKTKKITTTLSNENSSQNLLNTQSVNTKSILSEDLFQNIIKNEKDKLKYRLCFIKDFAIKYVIIISKIAIKIFDNADDWVIKSIQKENETQNEVISLLKNKLKQCEKINEEMEIDSIEMDAFDKRIDDEGRSNSSITEKNIRPIDNTSSILSGIYNKINIDCLKDDNFFDVEFEQINNNSIIKQSELSLYNEINEEKEYEIILPKKQRNYLSNYYIMSEKSISSNEEEIIKEKDFYFDLNKFYYIYKEISSLEEEKNIISYNSFFESFIKYYIFNDNEESVKFEYNAIAHNLKKLNIKQIMRLINLCKLNFEKKNEEKDTEYNTYIKTPEIFTYLALAGCPILTGELEEKILEYFNDKFINGGYVTKNEYMKYNFWFEKCFEFQKEKNLKDINSEEKEEIMTIKNFLFELWNDGNGNLALKTLLKVLRMSNYITDFVEYNCKKYFDVVFLEQ